MTVLSIPDPLPDSSDSPLVEVQQAPEVPAGPDSCGVRLLLFVWAAAIFVLTAALYGAGWLTEQLDYISGTPPTATLALVLTAVHGLLVAVPATLVARRTSNDRLAAALDTWAAAGLLILICLPVRFAPITAGQTATLLQIACLAFFLLLGRRFLRSRSGESQTPPYWAAVAVAALVSVFWVLWGAAGSWLDSLLNLVAALGLGAAVAMIARWRLLPDLSATSTNVRQNIGLGGLVLAAAMAAIGGGFGITGQNLILMVLLGSLGWLLMGIAYLGRGPSPAGGAVAVGLAVALIAAAPLILIDPEELLLVLNLLTRDVGFWAVRATLYGALIALALGGLAIALGERLPYLRTGRAGPATAAAVWGALALTFLWSGQTGFNGERLFVIMSEQTDWQLADLPDAYGPRREAVYAALVGQADRTQAHIRETLDRLGVDYTPYYLANAIEVDGGPLLRLWLESLPEVERVLYSPRLRPLPEPPPVAADSVPAPSEPQWNLTSIGATDVWTAFGVTGEGIVIGQADSGVELAHPELAGTYRGRQPDGQTQHDYNWFDPWTGTTAPVDFGGHGTHTLGTILGRSVGVAPGASWIACVNLERNLGNPALYLDCLQFLFAPFAPGGDTLRDGRPDLGAQVFNNSWGCPVLEGCDPGALLAAVQALRAAGVFVVASAGNEGSDCSTVRSPLSLYDEVFSVGATDRDGQLASFSSRGPVTADGSGRTKPDIAAPGVDILSSYPSGTYSYSDGTSMAGPHVAGVVALLWSADPRLIGDLDRTEALITSTAQPYDMARDPVVCGDPGALPNNATGYGLVDAYAAVEAALAASR